MKKILVISIAAGLLSACTAYNPDVDATQARRDARRLETRSEVGCPFAEDHRAYRDCVVNTYYARKPRTFTVSVLDDGDALAIVRNTSRNHVVTTEKIIVVETVETIMQPQTQTIVRQVPVQTIRVVEHVPGQPVVVRQPAPVAEQAPLPLQIVEETVVAPAPEKTWWETYQVAPQPSAVQCPCPNPNEPCAQCIDK